MKAAVSAGKAAEPGVAARHRGVATRPPNYGVGFADASRGARAAAPLTIGRADDPAEREADRLARRAFGDAAPLRPHRAAPVVARKCAACDEDDTRAVRRAPADGATAGGAVAPPSVGAALDGPGRALDPAARRFFEGRFQRSFGAVRLHDGADAHRAAGEIGARAFTLGADIGFARGAYAPDTPAGAALLAHELVHVAQQDGERATVRRACTHDGTPVNCHNWTLPLPPWIAGSIAHSQIAVWAGIPTGTIPRATKVFMGLPSSPLYPAGFADLWQNGAGLVNIGEIKSTATGSGVAAAEAAHYVGRHNEWMPRAAGVGGPPAADDAAYLARVGGLKPGVPLNLGTRTGTGTPVGPFAGDPGKTLHVEADALGAVVYWCTGIGLTNPLWLLAFKAAVDALKKAFQALKRRVLDMIDDVIEGVGSAARWLADAFSAFADWVSENLTTILLVLLAIIVVALIIIFWAEILAALAIAGAAIAAGAASIQSAIGLATAAAAILLLLGVSLNDFPGATRQAASALAPAAGDTLVGGADYDRGGVRPDGNIPAAAAIGDPGTAVLAALAPLANPNTLADAAISIARGGVNEAQLRRAIGRGVGTLRGAGDDASADQIGALVRSAGLG